MTVHDQTVVINITPGSEKPEASGLRPTDIVTQMDVVKLLVEHKDKLELVADKTLEELEIFEVGVGGGGRAAGVCVCRDRVEAGGGMRWRACCMPGALPGRTTFPRPCT